jgi:ABC-type amino acid transport substrate-binding protein
MTRLQSFSKILISVLILILFTMPVSALTLRTASQKGSEPKYILVNGQIEGLEVEIIEAVQKADPRIRITGLESFMPFKRIKREMEMGNLDCFFGFSYNEKRAEKFLFIQPPLYLFEYKMVMRADDLFEPKDFNDIRSLGKDNVILALFGTVGPEILKDQGGLLIDAGAKTVPALLKKLESKRGRFVFYQSFGTVHTIKQLGLERKFRLTKNSFADRGHYVVFPKATIPPDTVKQVEAALDKVRSSGELKRIVQKYTTVK